MITLTYEQASEIRQALLGHWGGTADWALLKTSEQREFAKQLDQKVYDEQMTAKAEAIARKPEHPYPEDEKQRIAFFAVFSKAYEDTRRRAEELYDLLEPTLRVFGLGSMFQDTEGTVYKVEVPAGTFVRFRSISWVRTRRAGEAKGTLSMEAAKREGFALPAEVEQPKKKSLHPNVEEGRAEQ